MFSHAVIDDAGVSIEVSRAGPLPSPMVTVTRFVWPMTTYVPFETLVLMTRIRGLPHASVWAYRWKASEARRFVERHIREIEAVAEDLESLSILCDLRIAPGYVWLEWPHFNCYEHQSGFTWKLKHDVERLKACLRPLAESVVRDDADARSRVEGGGTGSSR